MSTKLHHTMAFSRWNDGSSVHFSAGVKLDSGEVKTRSANYDRISNASIRRVAKLLFRYGNIGQDIYANEDYLMVVNSYGGFYLHRGLMMSRIEFVKDIQYIPDMRVKSDFVACDAGEGL